VFWPGVAVGPIEGTFGLRYQQGLYRSGIRCLDNVEVFCDVVPIFSEFWMGTGWPMPVWMWLGNAA